MLRKFVLLVLGYVDDWVAEHELEVSLPWFQSLCNNIPEWITMSLMGQMSLSNFSFDSMLLFGKRVGLKVLKWGRVRANIALVIINNLHDLPLILTLGFSFRIRGTIDSS